MTPSFNHDKELAEFFTDVEYLRDAFKNSVAAPELAKRLLVIHGVGGVGKSSLLRMFRLHCKSVNVPVALASGDDSKSALDVLTHWADDLKADNVALSSFSKTFEHYREIQAKVDGEAQKSRGKMADLAGKAAGKTAEVAGGALAGAALGSIIPGIGTIAGAIGGMGAEALVDWMRGFLTKPDIDLLLDPAKKLTDDFLDDIAKAAGKQRIVLMLDTFEQMTALDDWARDVAQRLPANVLFVITGRALPSWSRAWNGFMANAQIEELKPMTEDVMRELIGRYYATMRGGQPNPTQVDAIIRFARGLPMVVTSAVQLWVKYGVEDFQAVKAEIVANLVDRLIEGVPSTLIPALEAAAVVRWFDQPILRAVMKQDDVRDVYNELRRFPFVRTRVEGLALHDAVREIMDENLRAQDSERHCELHARAAAYFEKRLEKVTGEEAERLRLERLYHRVRADEEAGIKLFQEMAEELVRYRLVNRLRALLNDVNTYPLERENSKLWREYYHAKLIHLEGQWLEAEQVYQIIDACKNLEPKLQAYALCDWGSIRKRGRYVALTGGLQALSTIIERSNSLLPEFDTRRVMNLMNLAGAYQRLGQVTQAIANYDEAIALCRKRNDLYGTLGIFIALLETYAILGDWRKMFDARSKGLQITSRAIGSSAKDDLLGYWSVAWAWAGRYADAEHNARLCLNGKLERGETELDASLRDLGYAVGMQGKYDESGSYFQEAIENRKRISHQEYIGGTLAFWAAVLLRQNKRQLSEVYLKRSLDIRERIPNLSGMPENLYWLGQVYELDQAWQQSVEHYRKCLDYRWTSRHYFECAALTGLVRVKHAQGDYAAIPPLLAEAEQLAQQYEYNDHLASLRLTQAETSEVFGDFGSLSALDYFKQALIYALRYNRFLLDEVLSGRPQGTPLRPIIPYCLERGQEGKQMLIALRDWWKTGVNDIGTPRPDTISPIPEGIALVEAERITREREPGDGSPQKSVVEQIERALAGQ